MTLDEMMHILREDILHDRSDQVSGPSDHLWSDTTLCFYLNEAQRRFARKTLCIRDGLTPSCTQITTGAFQKEYTLDKSVIAVISAKFMGNGEYVNGVYNGSVKPDIADLARGGHYQFSTYNTPDRYYFNPDELSTLPPGKPLAFDTDEYTTTNDKGSYGVINFRSYPVPSTEYAGCLIQLRVNRMPLNKLSTANMDATPEIPEEYHRYLLDYAAYLALRIVDHELGDPERAAEFEQQFNKHVDEAKNEMLRKMFTPNVWGFGRNGFSFVGN